MSKTHRRRQLSWEAIKVKTNSSDEIIQALPLKDGTQQGQPGVKVMFAAILRRGTQLSAVSKFQVVDIFCPGGGVGSLKKDQTCEL